MVIISFNTHKVFHFTTGHFKKHVSPVKTNELPNTQLNFYTKVFLNYLESTCPGLAEVKERMSDLSLHIVCSPGTVHWAVT